MFAGASMTFDATKFCFLKSLFERAVNAVGEENVSFDRELGAIF